MHINRPEMPTDILFSCGSMVKISTLFEQKLRTHSMLILSQDLIIVITSCRFITQRLRSYTLAKVKVTH